MHTTHARNSLYRREAIEKYWSDRRAPAVELRHVRLAGPWLLTMLFCLIACAILLVPINVHSNGITQARHAFSFLPVVGRWR